MGTAMSSSIQCPQCSRVYSIDECEEDRFCRDCDTLLKINIKKSVHWRDLFPYDPYPVQVDFMEDVQKTVVEGGVLVAEACNGFGKGLFLLAIH